MIRSHDDKRRCAWIRAGLAAAILLLRSTAPAAESAAISTIATAGAGAVGQSAQGEAPAKEAEAEKPEETSGPAIPGLKFVIGTESTVELDRNRDLDKRVKDTLDVLGPELNLRILYEPVKWFEATLKLALTREIALLEEGERKEKRDFSLSVEEANLQFKDLFDHYTLQVGRRNFEDDRRWLYDLSMDAVHLTFEHERLRLLAEFSVSREKLVEPDLLKREPTDRINNYIFFLQYGAADSFALSAYTIFRDDREKREGRPILVGLRSLGTIFDGFSHWAEVAHVRGRDGALKLQGFAVDVAGTYRLPLPLNPYVSLGYAFGSGDKRPDDNTDEAFRQTGLQSNEHNFGGFADFKIYGEALDPELSNLQIVTAGLGFKPTSALSIDFVYHYYWQHVTANRLRNAAVDLDPNLDPSRQSRDLGSAVDVVVGLHDTFGIQGLGLELRFGYFFPGRAFRVEAGEDDAGNKVFRDADRAFVARFTINYEY